MTSPARIGRFRSHVDVHMRRLYGITWADACGDDAPLRRALADRLTSLEFTLRFGKDHDLDERRAIGV